MFGEIRNQQGEKIDYTVHAGESRSDFIAIIGHGVTGNKDRPFVVTLAQGLTAAGVDAATEEAIVSILQELKDQGKTLLVVHHDLPTAKTYFDSLLLLNMRVVAFGPTEEVFNYDLLQSTYGGRLTILSEVADAVGAKAR